MRNNFTIVTVTIIIVIFSTSLACHSINGVSKKAILLGLEKSTVSPKKEGKNLDESKIQANFSSLIKLGIPVSFGNKSEASSNASEPRHITGVPQTRKSSEVAMSSIREKEGNSGKGDAINDGRPKSKNLTTSNLSPNELLLVSEENSMETTTTEKSAELESFNEREIPGKLMQEETLIVDIPGVRFVPQISMPQMQPPQGDKNSSKELAMIEDNKVNSDWGGTCVVKDWKNCNNITVIGSETMFHPDFPYDPKKNIMTQLDCFDPMKAFDFPWLCLKNGWTVNRCHILCMSRCNKGLLLTRTFDLLVLHEGPCKTK